jgi:RNA polymerase sigma-70 factor (ECF subfamily)
MTADDPYADVPHTLTGGDAAGERNRTAAMREELLDLCEREYAQLVRFVMHAGADLGQAEDAVQEAFLAAWRHQAKIEVWERIGNHSAWLRTVALHSYWRPPGRKRRSSGDRVITETLVERLPERAAQPMSVNQIELSAQAMAVREALLALPRQQRILMAFLLDGFTVAETARELDMDEQKARDLVRKARRTLKRQLSSLGVDLRGEQGR